MVRLTTMLLLALTTAAMDELALAAAGPVCIENATIDDLQAALIAGRTSAADLVRAYTARIEAYDQAGPRLNAIREMNSDALAIAEALDARKVGKRRPLEGIPVLVKDNIATGDAQHTTAGSVALADAFAQRDATVVKLLRDAGAVILGTANLTEFANISGDRHAGGLFLSRRPSEKPLCAGSRREGCSDRTARRIELDAILFPGLPGDTGQAGAVIAAKAGYPSVHVPAGMISGIGMTATPEYPFGVTFTGRAWSKPVLLRLAYSFEQPTKARRMPPACPLSCRGAAPQQRNNG
jgi:Asp-tRNA(Asn)/Glu-tRNA(Gln) amidotransferase A subunit family amidase